MVSPEFQTGNQAYPRQRRGQARLIGAKQPMRDPTTRLDLNGMTGKVGIPLIGEFLCHFGDTTLISTAPKLIGNR